MAASEGEFFRTMVARVSPEDIVLYANLALATYLRVSKSDLIGSPLDLLATRAHGEVAACFHRPESGRASNRLVTDSEGRVFEVKTYSEGGILDIVLDEVTTVDSVSRDLRHVSGTSVDLLNEEELRTARQPERRFLSISRVRLNGISHLADLLAPMEMRLILNSFVEESADAILETGCTYFESSGSSVTGIFGAPRYFADHALRAIRSACSQMEKFAQLRAGLLRQGREMPPLSCGIWTGETFVGTLGASATQTYSAVGNTVDLAEQLSQLARPGEVLISEFTLRNLVQTLPQGWQAIEAESEAEPDLSDFHWTGEGLLPLPEAFVRKVWLIGPGVGEDSSATEYYADYLYALLPPGDDEPVPILRVVRPSVIGDSFELRGDNVISAPFSQSLGKYKLLSVVGTGGMGKVWKGQDRYGNVVAIKVLHESETSSESQLKRFRREAEVMSRLPHRNICRVFEMSEFEGIQFLVMEYVDGLTLGDLLYESTLEESSGSSAKPLPDLKSLIIALRDERSSRDTSPISGETEHVPRPKETRVLPIEQTLTLFLKVCEAVQFAHEHGVLHRDLKPGNILLREDGEPLVADFGLAKLSNAEAGQSLSVSGHVVGTLENMSPEQAESSKDVDERADVYALGTILFQMLTGRRHFEATGNIVADAQALQNHEPPRLRSLNPRLDSDLEVIVLKSLRNSPVERYRSVAALAADLEHYRRGEPISARPVSAIELCRKLVLRNRGVSAVITFSLLLFLAGSVAAFWQITDRAHAAESALKEAEIQKDLAMKNELLAKEQKQRAEARRVEAQEALENMKLAQAERDASDLAKNRALNETEQERKLREESEKEAASRIADIQGKVDELKQLNDDLRAKGEAEPAPMEIPELFRPRNKPDMGLFRESQRAMAEAVMAFHRDLNPGELSISERNPERILSKISSGLDSISRALLANPTLSQAWVVKGRYHLACMETAQAKEAFAMALQSAEARRVADQPDLLGVEHPEPLVEIADQLMSPSADRFDKGAELLSKTGAPEDQMVAEVLRFFKDKPLVRRATLGQSLTGRTPGIAETAISLLAANGGKGRVEIAEANGQITFSGFSRLDDLSLLKSLATTPAAIRIRDAGSIDWATLASLPIESLDLTGCQLADVPSNLRGFNRIKTLSLKDAGISNAGLLRIMPLLTSLDLSGTAIRDLSPLALSRRIQTLDVSLMALDSVRPLLYLPLASLTISPLMVSDKASLNSLRGLRTLRVIRTPEDPADQPAAEFWRKLSAGEYDTGG